ncbi:MAG: Ig-like domain-containing protein, partial [Clostridia bacterium]|nr:Ig-like domain-containing protein [Clostridia bacterium]
LQSTIIRRRKIMSKNDYLIRLERKEDYPVVENLIRESFWNVYRPGCLEHYLITKLREHPNFVKELDFVMEKDGEIIGQNVFVKANIKADDGRNIPILTMGPICITPKLKRQGYGKILLDYSTRKATELGFGAVCFEDEFKELLATKNTIMFDKVNCLADTQTYLYTDFFIETVNITNISIEKKSLGLYVGESATIVAQITPSNATEGYYWESDNELVAKVDGAGCVTALSEGIATITAASENGDLKASCVVYVSTAINEDEPTIYCDSIEETKNGKSFDVNISLRNNPGIASMRLSLTYDASVMTLVNVSDLGLLGESVHSSDYTAESYTLYWDNGTATSNFTTDGAIVTLTFTIKSDAKSGDYPIIVDYDFNNDDIVNCELIPVKFEIVNGFVTVKSFVYGDVNDDGKVNPLDSAYLSRYLAKWPGVTINLDAADTNGDGKVNPLDSAILKRHIAKWPEYANLPYQNSELKDLIKFESREKIYPFSANYGYAQFNPKKHKTIDDLLLHCDKKLIEAKKRKYS